MVTAAGTEHKNFSIVLHFFNGFIGVITVPAVNHYVRVEIIIGKYFLQRILAFILVLGFVGVNMNR